MIKLILVQILMEADLIVLTPLCPEQACKRCCIILTPDAFSVYGTLHTKIVKHRLHVCVQNAGVFWCSGVSQEMKIKDVHEMYSWI